MAQRRMIVTFAVVLGGLGALALLSHHLTQAKLRVHQAGVGVLTAMDHQYALLERTAVLAQQLPLTREPAAREFLHAELQREIERWETSQAEWAAQLPPSLRGPLREYLADLRALVGQADFAAAESVSLADAIAARAIGALAQDLADLSREQQRRIQTSLGQLRRFQGGVLVATWITLAALGWFVFRPLVRRVAQEHEERVRAERLALIGSMAATFAHEIRNPLGAIRLNLDSVIEELAASLPTPAANQPPTAVKLLQSIDGEVRRIQRISDGYLQFARLPKVNRQLLSLNDWLQRQWELCAREFAQRRIAVRWELAADVPAVPVDGEQLWQALLNIIRNAADAMPAGGSLIIRTAHSRTHVQIAFTDTGLGMTEQQQRAVFQPFFTDKPGGTGLGLVLTQQIIREHGGRINCASRPGVGTTFTVELPLSPPTA